MPPELFYYLVWYVLSRIALLVGIHLTLRANAEKGIRGLASWEFLLAGFIPVVPELMILLMVAIEGIEVLAAGIGWAHTAITDFYLSRYGGRRE